MSEKIYDICIIGAGASGLVAAIESSRRGLSSVVVDKNKKPGAKLYATGNGRCNLTNDDWDDDVYYDNPFPFRVFDLFFEKYNMRPRSFVVDYFKKLGINTINKHGYFYPESMQASSVVWALTDAVRQSGAEMVMGFEVTDIKDEEYFNERKAYVISDDNGNHLYARNILISTGGMSQVKSLDNPGFAADISGIYIRRFAPGLCPVLVKEDLTEISGVRCRSRIKAGSHSEVGELQITDKGISGIVTFDMSYYMSQDDTISINVLPGHSLEEMLEAFNSQKIAFPDKNIILFLNGYINDKLSKFFVNKLYGEMAQGLKIKDITDTGIKELYEEMSQWELTVKEKGGFEVSQASIGGISTDIIDPETMMIKTISDRNHAIYVAGEATDVIGKCGGYNLTYAFLTGFVAGRSCR